jgi:hypothetical protein
MLSPKSHDDPRNLLKQPNHRNYEDYKEDQEEQQQWLRILKTYVPLPLNGWTGP